MDYLIDITSLSNAELVDLFDRTIVALCYETMGDDDIRESTEHFYSGCKAELLRRLGE